MSDIKRLKQLEQDTADVIESATGRVEEVGWALEFGVTMGITKSISTPSGICR